MNKQSASTALEESPSSRAAASPHNELLMRFPLSGQLISISPDMRFQRTGIFNCDGRFIDSGTLTVYIRRLRKKIEDDPSDPVRITTVRGMGYIWNSEVDR